MTTAVQTIIIGQLLAAKTATFKDSDGNDIAYGKVQLLIPDMSGDFHAIQNIKVRTENYGMLPDLQQQKGKKVRLECSTSQYKDKVSYYLEKVA